MVDKRLFMKSSDWMGSFMVEWLQNWIFFPKYRQPILVNEKK